MNTEREIIKAAQAISFGASVPDSLVVQAARIYISDYSPRPPWPTKVWYAPHVPGKPGRYEKSLTE